MAFWGCVLKPGQTKKVESPEGEILHLSQACLAEPKDGKNYVQATVDGTTFNIACLEKGKKEHDSFDLFFDPTACAFANKGTSDVHLTGYFEPDDGEDDEAAAAPAKVVAKTSPKAAAQASPKLAQASPKVAAGSPKLAAPAAAAESDSEELIEEGEESEALEESEEEAAAAPPAAKRKAEATPAASPAKAAKTSPVVAPAGGDTAAYVKALSVFLKQNGKQSLSVLGSKVVKPAGAPKMKVVLAQNGDKFLVKDGFATLK
jgi:nucleophosmin 1